MNKNKFVSKSLQFEKREVLDFFVSPQRDWFQSRGGVPRIFMPASLNGREISGNTNIRHCNIVEKRNKIKMESEQEGKKFPEAF